MSYPTLEDVLCADVETLQGWERSLPPPQADVEHTVRRRIARRLAPPKPAAEPQRTEPPRMPRSPLGEAFGDIFEEIFGGVQAKKK